MDLEAPDQELPTQHMARSRTVTMSDFDVRLPRQDTEYYCTKLLNDELDATVSMCRCVDVSITSHVGDHEPYPANPAL
jgi:hypothetical protein